MIRSFLFSAVIVAFGCGAAAQADEPVLVGGEVDEDACSSFQYVGGGGANAYAGPGENFDVLGELPPGDLVLLCDTEGSWEGIVWPVDNLDCGVGSPITPRQAYSGPCPNGWVHRDFLVDELQ